MRLFSDIKHDILGNLMPALKVVFVIVIAFYAIFMVCHLLDHRFIQVAIGNNFDINTDTLRPSFDAVACFYIISFFTLCSLFFYNKHLYFRSKIFGAPMIILTAYACFYLIWGVMSSLLVLVIPFVEGLGTIKTTINYILSQPTATKYILWATCLLIVYKRSIYI